MPAPEVAPGGSRLVGTPPIGGECVMCRAPIGNAPFCPFDGTLVDRFVIGDRYVIDERIGGSRFTFVFGGHHLVLGKPVAIKILRSDRIDSPEAQRFLREARTASQLSHENIISVLDFGRDDGRGFVYLVMERFAGITLAEVLRASSSSYLPGSRAIPILVQTARALGAAHAAQVVHRDVNPRNVLLGRGDFVKLCDFGLSRSLAGDDRLTTTGTLSGTPAYMAPEQIRGEELDGRADVYGFGCTAYEMLAGKLPHSGTTPAAMFANRLNGEAIAPIAQTDRAPLPAGLEDLVMRCLATDPSARPAATEIESWLVAINAGSGRSPGSSDPGVQRIGSYDVLRRLGAGGAGTVFLGKHPVIGTKVAIKVLHPEVATVAGMSDRFIQEARASSELNNPHIPRYFDFGVLETGQPYSVIEYLEGETLGDRLDRDRTVSLAEAATIVSQVASAMAAVHDAGIIHRDIKPDNLFLTTDPVGHLLVKILDFGIAKALAPGGSAAQTSVGLVMGTPYYCAPEQAMGLAVDAQADIYALGATAFEMLAGVPPFEGNVAVVMGAKTTRSAPLLRTVVPSVPRSVASTIDRMLVRDPQDRLRSMRELIDEVSRWELQPVTGVGPTDLAMPSETFVASDTVAYGKLAPAARSRWMILGAAAAAAIAVCAVIAVVLMRGGAARSAASAPPSVLPAAVPTAPPAAPTPPSSPPPAPAPAIAPSSPSMDMSAGSASAGDATPSDSKKHRKSRRKTTGSNPQSVQRDDAVIVDPFKEDPR